MYALHKVLFLAIMSATLYFNEVESFAMQTMLNNNTEASEYTLGGPSFVGVSAQTVACAHPTAKYTCTVPTILKRVRS